MGWLSLRRRAGLDLEDTKAIRPTPIRSQRTRPLRRRDHAALGAVDDAQRSDGRTSRSQKLVERLRRVVSLKLGVVAEYLGR